MDCDQVFNVLTRGPFPSGSPEDPYVQHHLECCQSCWRIAEALRPAEHLFQEAVPPSESRDLPGYWGDSTPPGVTVARIAAEASRTVVAPSPRPQVRRLQIDASYDRTAQRGDLVCVAAILLSVMAIPLVVWWLF